MAIRNTILLRGNAREEARIADVYAITPGMLLELADAGTVIPHTTSGGQVFAVIFAREQHENQGGNIDDDVIVDDEVTIIFPELGAKINAYTADTIAEGEPVCSDGSGGVRLADSGDYVLGVAAEDSDLSGSNGRCEIYIGPGGVSA